MIVYRCLLAEKLFFCNADKAASQEHSTDAHIFALSIKMNQSRVDRLISGVKSI